MIMLHSCIGCFPVSSLNYDNFILKELGSFHMCLPMPQSHSAKPLDKLQNAKQKKVQPTETQALMAFSSSVD